MQKKLTLRNSMLLLESIKSFSSIGIRIFEAEMIMEKITRKKFSFLEVLKYFL